jgi:hypothetical protein
MRYCVPTLPTAIAFCALLSAGCESPYHADRGALFGGLTGAGLGAVVGHAMGNTGAGAAIGAGLGAITGAAVGAEMDEAEARNRAIIEGRLGRRVAPGAVTVGEVVAMVHAGVSADVVCTHIRKHGVAAQLQSGDLILLQQERVPAAVVRTMQETPVRQVEVVASAPPPVVVYDPYYPPPPCYYHPPPPHVSWGVTIR